ncbi:PDZ domain-containing protein [Pareuzebyella sediminis]|uniref:PDZ domain-containing protein n=1 Tax=Pareuzebyella sediminis TaxID=2607998 RepID=UPI0011EC285C|nr:PDZ domain-containing protein [Pareuzebyella sediminis]
MRATQALLVLLCFMLMGCDSSEMEIYVKPNSDTVGDTGVNSIQEALDKIAVLREKNNMALATITLGKGEYRLNTPVRIGPEHGAVKLIGEGTENTVIKGSRRYSLKWTKYKGSVYVAPIVGQERFDQLFINGRRQILARYPNYDENGGHWQGYASDAIDPNRIEKWQHPHGAILHVMHQGEWGGFHYKVEGIDKDGSVLLSGGHQNNRPSAMHERYRMVENVFEELDSEGEWFLDAEQNLYYWPPKDLDLQNAKVEGTLQKCLVNVQGTKDNPVKDVSIEGIRFEHTQRTFMEAYELLLRSDWTMYRGGSVFLQNTEEVAIKNCEFTALGGNVIFVSDYNRNVVISDNHIHDCGASGIAFVGSPKAVRSPSFQYNEYVPLNEMDTLIGPKTDDYPSDCLVENNLIHRIGRIEKQTAGVEIAMAMNITVRHNSIYEVPRAGINIGDGTWGGHTISFNDVFNTVLESGDHGAFNSWGRDRFWHPNRNTMDSIVAMHPEMPKWDAVYTTEIFNNRFRCDHGWDIDLDDGSSNYNIYNNVCLNGGIKLREGFFRTVENNIMINNGFHPHVWFKNSGDIFRHNIVFTEHKDIRLQGWGAEVDYNLFGDDEALQISQKNGVGAHSVSGSPRFKEAATGNFDVSDDSPALQIGFESFETQNVGVNNEKLKVLAKTPEIPRLLFGSQVDKSSTFQWLGAEIKSIETMGERSAAGLSKTAGILVLSLDDTSVLKKSGIAVGDVIVASEEEELDNVSDLMKFYQNNNWKGQFDLVIFRNQKKLPIHLKTK